jgi:hypothetical protein
VNAAQLSARSSMSRASRGITGVCLIAASPSQVEPVGDHPPPDCCRHVFSSACPVDCLRVVLGTAAFHALARADRAPFGPPATAGQVVELFRTGQLGLAFGLGPRRLGETQAALVLAGFAVSDVTMPARGLPPGAGGGPAGCSDQKED